MATKNPRINVTLDKETAKYLTLMAKKRKKTISVTARELIESALEEVEDSYWGDIALTRMKAYEQGKDKLIAYEDFWKPARK
ncbi:MAG: hypothetical protein ACK5WQ_05540 [Alphaproteobacteria bacterium]|jgi:predicted DNA-binding protein